MAHVVVVFESRYGQSDKIAEHIADLARKKGHSARTIRASLATHPRLASADGVVVVAPVYFGRHPLAVHRFLKNFGELLSSRASAFVSVSNAAAEHDAHARDEAMRLAHHAIDDAGLRACAVVTAGGALAYPRYGFFLRLLMAFIARRTGLPTGLRRVHELTDWDALDDALEPFFAAPEVQGERMENGAPASRRVPAEETV